MSKQDIIDRIISDAEGEANAIIAEAEETAARIITEAKDAADRQMNEVKVQTSAKAKSIVAGKQATARLESSKIMLAEKRKVIDDVYDKAAQGLKGLSREDCLTLTDKLLNKYAEEGDEIVFADSFPCVKEVHNLPVVQGKKLKISFGNNAVDGGFILCGKNCDKDLSFAALLAADREKNEADIAAEIFK
jgi:V/A-type H+-transporting ATPase subunit E